MIRLPRTALHCPACRHLASTASSSSTTAFASSSRSSSTLHTRPRLTAAARTHRTATGWKRGVATEAVQRQEIEEEEPEREVQEEEPNSLVSEPTATRSEAEEMDALVSAFESSLTPAEPTPIPSAIAEAPSPPPIPSLSPSTLLAPSFPSGPPSPSDLDTLAPRPFTTPDASSPDSHRLIYSRLWSSTFTRLEKAFTKTQLLAFVSLPTEDGGLGLDLKDPRWKTNQKGSAARAKNWRPKIPARMSKKELAMAVMVLRWEMTNPDVLPSGKKGPQKVDAVVLSDRTLFLLLSPNSTTIPLLTRQLGLSYSFARNPESGALSLVLRGNVKSVDMGRREVEGVGEAAHTRLLRLPAPASTLRPEVYQSISRMAKAFLEPAASEGEDVLQATATEERYLERLERYLLAAFSHDASRRSLPQFITLPTALSSTTYTFSPFTPPVRTPFITGGSSSSYARIKSVGRASELAEQDDGEGAGKSPFEELMSWSGKMGIEAMERVALGSISKPIPAGEEDKAPGMLDSLLASLPSTAEGGEGTEYELTGSFGHVLWPLYPAGEGKLGPVMEAEWGVQELLKWRAADGAEARTAWVGSPPTNFLPSTGVLTPTQQPLTPFSPFASLTTLPSTTPASEIVASGPKLDNEGFRRVVYRPVEVGEGEKRVEVEFEGGWRVRSRKKVEERKVEVLVPTGSNDFKITLTKRQELPETEIPDFPPTGDAPSRIFVDSQPYLLDTDRWIRRTIVDAPPPSPSPVSQLAGAFSTSPSTSSAPLHSRQIQETFHDRTIEGSRGVEVSVQLASPSRLGADPAFRLGEMRRNGVWKKALEGMERRACDSTGGARSRLAGAGDVSQRVFSVGR